MMEMLNRTHFHSSLSSRWELASYVLVVLTRIVLQHNRRRFRECKGDFFLTKGSVYIQ